LSSYNEAVKNIGKIRFSLPAALKMVTFNHVKVLGVGKLTGSINTGKKADITVFDKDFNIIATIINGDFSYIDQKRTRPFIIRSAAHELPFQLIPANQALS